MTRSLFTRTFEAVNEIPFFYHSNETSSAVLSHSTIYLACGSYFWVCGPNTMVLPFEWNLFSGTRFHMVLFISYVVVVTFKSWMKSYGVTIHETSLAALLHGAINLVGFYKRDFWTFGEFVLICYCPEWTGLKHYRGRGGVLDRSGLIGFCKGSSQYTPTFEFLGKVS